MNASNASFSSRRSCAQRAEDRLPTFQARDTKQILESLALVERVALHIEEEIARPRLRQPREPASLLRWQELVDLLASRALVQLQARLLTEPLEGRPSNSRGAVPGLRTAT